MLVLTDHQLWAPEEMLDIMALSTSINLASCLPGTCPVTPF